MNRVTKLLRRIIWKLDKTISKWFFRDQWVIMMAKDQDIDSLSWSDFTPLDPPPDRYWADPFVIAREGLYYLFIEEKMYKTKKGHISCLILDASGKILSNKIVLEHPYHLSYPFLFEYEDQLYMMPETAQNRSLDIYRCVEFPHQWEFVQPLMTDVYAVDATLLEHGGKWWLFMNMKEQEDSSSLDQLFIFHADTPLSNDWTAHPQNPVVEGFRRARPGGSFFSHQENLYRPSQDNWMRYGYALNFNRIAKLSETEYEEFCETRFEPSALKNILATHTFNKAENMIVIDAKIRRLKSRHNRR